MRITRLIAYSVAGMRDSTQAVWQRLPDHMRNAPYGDVTEGIAMLALGRNADAERAFREGEAALGHPSPLRVVALARLGRTAEARAQLKVVEQAFGKPYFGPVLIQRRVCVCPTARASPEAIPLQLASALYDAASLAPTHTPRPSTRDQSTAAQKTRDRTPNR